MDKTSVKIKVIGVGGAGSNAINDLIEYGVAGVEFIAANTDAQDLNRSLADIKVQLGEELTKGFGAMENPEVGRLAAEKDEEKLKKLLEDTDVLFIASGMGGGTGTGSSPVIARIAKDMGIFTVAVVTSPFSFEGKKRKTNSDMGIEQLKENVDSLIIIPCNKLYELPDKNITPQNAFEELNSILKIMIKRIVDLMAGNGLITLDIVDIKTILQNSGIAVLGFGEGEGDNRAIKATNKALHSPLLEKSISGASKILININGPLSTTVQESVTISKMIREAAGGNLEDVMFGLAIDEKLGEKIQVTIIANNFVNKK